MSSTILNDDQALSVVPSSRITTYTEDLISPIRTTCPYCGVGCGVLANIDEAGVVSVTGDPEHPANFGKLCSKGSALAQTLGTERRLTQPYYQNKQRTIAKGQPTDTQPVEWEAVLDDIASRLNNTIVTHGRDSVMFYVSGQLLTEDYYVANKFIKGFIGNNNIDSNSRLCMSSAVAGHKRAFGADLVPSNYEDLEFCDLLVLVGSNMAWCHPILFGRFLAAKKRDPNKKLIVIDPRRTDSCEFADLHLPIAVGTDTHLYNGLLHYLEQEGCGDKDYLKQCHDVKPALEAAKTWTIDKVATACGISADLVQEFYALVAANDKTVTAFSMGVNQSASGTDKVNAIINTHLYTGRVGRVGASPFSLTGQPNAMGGREVGALANLLAAHLDLDNEQHRHLVADFWQAPQPLAAEVGVKACDAADAILDGRIKAIWIMATNPIVSLPEADKFRRALATCDLVIVSDCSVDSDTVKCADIVLPAQGWGEKSGTVTNSERRISRQRALMPALGQAKPDWWILSQVAKRMGLLGFDYHHPSEIFNEHIALTAYRNDASQALSDSNQPRYLNLAKDLSLEPVGSLELIKPDHLEQQNKDVVSFSRDAYDVMTPFQWGGARITPSKTKFIAITPPSHGSLPNRHPQRLRSKSADSQKNNDSHTLHQHHSGAVDLRLITGRLRDQWHTMTRTGLAPQLNQHASVPTLTVHPHDAKQLGVDQGDYVQLRPCYDKSDEKSDKQNLSIQSQPQYMVSSNTTTDSQVLAQVAISDSMIAGDAFMPMHWSRAFARFARVGTLIPTVVDPHSGQPELKNSAISVMPVPMKTYGKILVHPDLQDTIIVHLRETILNSETESEDKNTPISSCDTNADFEIADALPALPALTWSLSRQTNSVLITLASPIDSVVSKLLDADYWQHFIHTYQTSLANESINSAFTCSKQAKQLRFVSTQVDADSKAIDHASISTSKSDIPRDQLLLSVCFAPQVAQLPSIHWLNSCFASTDAIPENQRHKWLLAGRPATGYVDPGPLVCSCMAVGENIIIETITKQQCMSAHAVGKACRAGTNCGSCVSQINTLIEKYAS
ncbi:molybdopterin-dependent oxidoreductase [Psychrobacter sp.]